MPRVSGSDAGRHALATSPSTSTTARDVARPDGPDWIPTEEERSILLDPARLTLLHEARLLDVAPPDEFERLVSLLARALGVPLAYLSIVDGDRQFFLSAVGLPEPLATTRESGLDASFCKHVVLDQAPLVIPDASSEPRVAGNLAIEALGIGAYIGVPVGTADGVRIGALCVVDREPHAWKDEEQQVVIDTARVVEELLAARVSRVAVERERRDKLQILHRITEGFVTLDRDWRVVFANAAAGRLARTLPDHAVGSTLWELMPSLADSDVGEWLRERMGTTGTYEYEWKGIANPGWFEMRLVCSSASMSLYIRDISRRKQTELALAASEYRYRQLTNVATAGIFETDATGTCVFVNEACSEIAGRPTGELLGAGWECCIHPDDRPGVMRDWSEMTRTCGELRRECRLVRPGGAIRWVAAQATPLRDGQGNVTGFIGTLADITERKAHEEQLRVVNERLQLALLGSDIGLWDWHVPSGKVHFSERLPRMLGFAPDEFHGHVSAWASRIHPDDVGDVTRDLTAHLEGATPFYRSAHRLMTKSGRWKWILDAGAVVERDCSGAPVRAIGTHVDIDNAKGAEARFRLLFEQSREPMLLLDQTGVVECNRATLDTLRISDESEVLGVGLRSFYPPTQPDGVPSTAGEQWHAAIARRVKEDQFEWTFVRRDGTSVPLEISVARAEHKGGELYLMTWHDLTQQRENERILREAKEAAELASRTKSEFLARMSHELRSPLNSIIGFSGLLQRQVPSEIPSTVPTYLDRIYANGVHLLGLINNLLDIARIEAGKTEVVLSRGDVAQLVRETVQQLEGEAAGRPIVLRVEIPAEAAWLECDHDKLRQVLINLVGNAIKFTPSGEVVVRLQLSNAGVPVAIEVQDSGVGIAADRLRAIFEPFEQGESGTNRRFGGTGLGLAISKQLCDLMGYHLSVVSRPGAGSTFRVAFEGGAGEDA
ncbi:MAG: PAS domain S-box protein [Gemmatimonadaceae bacterium]|nr:PAS domain S-box protein [Gemmatimonadaceae bacterium]